MHFVFINLFNPNFRGYKGMLLLPISGFHLLTSLILHHIKKATNIYVQHTWAKNALAWMCFINVGVTPSFIVAARVLRSFSFSEDHISSLPPGQWKCGELPKWASTILHLLKYPWSFFLPLFPRDSSLLARGLPMASQNSSPVLPKALYLPFLLTCRSV